MSSIVEDSTASSAAIPLRLVVTQQPDTDPLPDMWAECRRLKNESLKADAEIYRILEQIPRAAIKIDPHDLGYYMDEDKIRKEMTERARRWKENLPKDLAIDISDQVDAHYQRRCDEFIVKLKQVRAEYRRVSRLLKYNKKLCERNRLWNAIRKLEMKIVRTRAESLAGLAAQLECLAARPEDAPPSKRDFANVIASLRDMQAREAQP